YDPAAVAERWHGPVLILQGGADMQVRPEDAGLLAAAMPQARRADLPGVTHMLKADLPGRPYATYTDPALPLAPGVVPAILEAVDGR
ncbi:alpha/beta hydrolase, partial [Rhodovulum sulfidophilum]|nr:alpha/beta hydrolase [Rhodovulum sulfidophilum]